jgi:hypothetical protein
MFRRPIYPLIVFLILIGGGALVFIKVRDLLISSPSTREGRPSFDKDVVIGTWDDILDSQSFEFRPDGTVLIAVKNEVSARGTYTVNEKDLGMTIVVNEVSSQFRWQDDRLVPSVRDTLGYNIFSKRPAESNYQTIPCVQTTGGVLINRGNGNYEMPEPEHLITTNSQLVLMMVAGAQWTHKAKEDTIPGTECIGYTRSSDEIARDIKISGEKTPNPSILNKTVFAVYEVRQ